MEKNYFEELYSINVNDNVEKKNNLSYLSWAWAIAETLKRYPNMEYEIMTFENNLPYVYDDKTGYMVFTKVKIEGVERVMWLPVMNEVNKAMLDHPYTYKVAKYEWQNKKKVKVGEEDKTVEAASMFDINKTIMRCLTKNLAMFGLGLYIYAGEDLPEEEAKRLISEEQLIKIKQLVPENKIQDMLLYYKLDKIENMPYTTAEEVIERKTKKNEATV